MAKVLELRPRAQEEFTSSLGMIVFLASWAMMFCALFFAYGFARTRAGAWPPPGMPRLPLAVPALNTVVLIASSLVFRRGLALLRAARRRAFAGAVAGTFALGAAFLALQFSVWISLWQGGFTVRSGGIYSSIFYALTAFHALHVAVGLLILLYVLLRTAQGKYTEHNHVNVRLCTMYWHFVDVVWVLMFLTLYVL
ncbi:MAG TPA: heme-copper oxidase subunit III [Minicystis sp.]|nr:heme-copper oxidase subunit III [Minicystis sp.]